MSTETFETELIGIVTPWFGARLTGGAEQQAWQLARRLAARNLKVEVLTTCNAGFESDWTTNDLDAGAQALSDNLTVRRFPVDTRDRAAFDRVNRKLLDISTSGATLDERLFNSPDEQAFLSHNINSAALAAYVCEHAQTYRAILFIPYLYGTTLNVLPVVANSGGRALLQPCLHDEAYARLPAVAEIFYRARRILFNSAGEAELAAQLYGAGILPRSVVVGEGIEWEDLIDERRSIADAEARAGDELKTDRLADEDVATKCSANKDSDDPLKRIDAAFDRLFAPDAARFVLYLGRKSRAKNVDLLLAAFAHFKASNPSSSLRLALAGAGAIDETLLPEAMLSETARRGLFDLGFVNGRAKPALLKNCSALFQPSRNESYSRAMMEAWACGKTVAAHRACLATATAVEQSGGGWLAGDDVAEWAQMFAQVETTSADALAQMGARGHAYAGEFADWDKVLDRYLKTFDSLDAERQQSTNTHASHSTRTGAASATGVVATRVGRAQQTDKEARAIHQLLPDLAYGDAISNQAIAIRERLRAQGYRSEIFVKRAGKRVAHEAKIFNQHNAHADQVADKIAAQYTLATQDKIAAQDALIYHHSIGSELTRFAVAHAGAKCLVYHNITPAEFFAPYRPGFAWMLEAGRAELCALADSFPVAVGDSRFNADEIAQCGFTEPGVLPIIIDPARWSFAADRRLLGRLQDGRTNLLFVGRVAPNKRQDELVETFKHYLTFDPSARLVLVGDCRDFDPFCRLVKSAARELVKNGRIVITRQVTEAGLAAYYRAAHVFVSLSEHEGFCAPVVEAMWFDVPVLAYVDAKKSSAVGETLGDAGVKLHDKRDLRAVAEKIRALVTDRDLRRRVIAGQRVRRERFTPAAVQPELDRLITRMLRGMGEPVIAASVKQNLRVAS